METIGRWHQHLRYISPAEKKCRTHVRRQMLFMSSSGVELHIFILQERFEGLSDSLVNLKSVVQVLEEEGERVCSAKDAIVMAISRLRCFPVAKVRVHDHKCYIHAAVSGRVITGGVNPADLRIWRQLLPRRGKV